MKSQYILSLLLVASAPLQADINPLHVALGLVGGGFCLVTGAFGYHLAVQRGAHKDQLEQLSATRSLIDTLTMRYQDHMHSLTIGDENERLHHIARNVSVSSTLFVNRLESDIVSIQRHVSTLNAQHDEKNNVPDREVVRLQAEKLVERLQTIRDFVKKEQIFIELKHGLDYQHKRFEQYKDMHDHAAPFPVIKVVDHINNDAHTMLSHLDRADRFCKDQSCRDVHKEFIARAQGYVQCLKEQRTALQESAIYKEELKRYEPLAAQEAEARWRLAVARAENNKIELEREREAQKTKELQEKLEAQVIRKEELRQDALKLEQGTYFDEQKKQYQQQFKSEKERYQKDCREQIQSIEEQKESLKAELVSQYNHIEQLRTALYQAGIQAEAKQIQLIQRLKDEHNKKLGEIHREVEKLDEQLHKQPYSPESDEAQQLAEILKPAIELARVIHEYSSPDQAG